MKKLGNKILKIVGIMSLITMIIFMSFNYIVFNVVFSDIQQNAKKTALESINSIDSNKLSSVIKNNTMNSDEYKEIQESMINYKNNEEIKYFYTLAPSEDGKNAYYLVDSAKVNASELGEKVALEDAMKQAFNGNVAFNKTPTKYEGSTYFSAYAPIKDSNGTVIAISGVDIDITNFLTIKNTIFNGALITTAIVLILSIIATHLFSRRISKNAGKIKKELSKMAEGDLTTDIVVKSNDEFEIIADSVNEFRGNAASMIRTVKATSNEVMAQSQDLGAISKEMVFATEINASSITVLEGGTSRQAQEINKVDEDLISFGQMVDATAKAIETINSNMGVIEIKARDSSDDLKALEDSIKDINIAFADIKGKINGLEMHLSRVNEITNLINSIADQTNLLALNASIEAARAGEAGRGFTVVAEEIRKLAEQSKVSSENINELIVTISTTSGDVAITSEKMNDKLVNQIDVIEKSADSFRNIIQNIENIIPKIHHINDNVELINRDKGKILKSTQEVTLIAKKINENTEEISASSQELNAASEEINNMSKELDRKAVILKEAIECFKI